MYLCWRLSPRRQVDRVDAAPRADLAPDCGSARAQSRIRKITDEMRHLQEQKNEALRMKLRGEVDAKTFRAVTAEIDTAHDQLAREHNRRASEAAMPELPDPSLAWEDLSAEDRRALTELLVDKIVVARHPTRSSTAGATTSSAPFHTKIARWKPRA